MIEQTGVAVTFVAQFLVSGAKGTGLTITCSVYKVSDGSSVVTGQAATEIGTTGVYKYTLASGSVPAEDLLVAVFNEAAATADQTDVPSMWAIGKAGVEKLDAAVSGANTTTPPTAAAVADAIWDEANSAHVTAGTTGFNLNRLAGTTVTVSSPTDSSGTISLVRGDDYDAADSREISFSSTGWADLTGATAVTLSIRKRASKTGLGTTLRATISDTSGSRVVGGGTQTVVFEPTAAQTADLDVGTAACVYDVQATLASGNIVTLSSGVVNVTEDQTRA
jgi:hypothetical protein